MHERKTKKNRVPAAYRYYFLIVDDYFFCELIKAFVDRLSHYIVCFRIYSWLFFLPTFRLHCRCHYQEAIGSVLKSWTRWRVHLVLSTSIYEISILVSCFNYSLFCVRSLVISWPINYYRCVSRPCAFSSAFSAFSFSANVYWNGFWVIRYFFVCCVCVFSVRFILWIFGFHALLITQPSFLLKLNRYFSISFASFNALFP